MAKANVPDNQQEVLDSRDIIERIEALEADKLEAIENGEAFDSSELDILTALAEEASGSPDWKRGETLIRDSYFLEYAQELAEDIGAIDKNASWPNNCIDWERAARELKYDYFSVDFDGVEYWIRS